MHLTEAVPADWASDGPTETSGERRPQNLRPGGCSSHPAGGPSPLEEGVVQEPGGHGVADEVELRNPAAEIVIQAVDGPARTAFAERARSRSGGPGAGG